MSEDRRRHVLFKYNKKFFYHLEVLQGWCTGMTQRDGMGVEVGEGLRMGNRCTPMKDSSQCMAKPIQYCKVK